MPMAYEPTRESNAVVIAALRRQSSIVMILAARGVARLAPFSRRQTGPATSAMPSPAPVFGDILMSHSTGLVEDAMIEYGSMVLPPELAHLSN
jgi:hypothetical protein